ncbi:DHH family phosphoesterase [Flavonifractor plautii]|nr:DHH family phosphoesterase [Flavonifractor plautii]
MALKLVLALGGPARRDELLERYADLAAIGTVADVMSLTGENRTIVRLGLEALRRTGRPGLRALLHEAGLDERPLTATAIGYTLAPASMPPGGWGAPPWLGNCFSRTTRPGEELSRALCDLNRERQAIEAEIYTECQAMAEALPRPQRHALVLAGEQWHQGWWASWPPVWRRSTPARRL